VNLRDVILKAARDGAQDGMRIAAEAVLEEAKRNLPVGDPQTDPDPAVSLKESGRVERQVDGGYRVIFDAPYAAYQHENLHAKHPRGGGPKYLERALTTLAPQLDRFVAPAVRAQVDRRAGRRGNRPA
jgi:hypothetical protein